jgi:hypothetical protein
VWPKEQKKNAVVNFTNELSAGGTDLLLKIT